MHRWSLNLLYTLILLKNTVNTVLVYELRLLYGHCPPYCFVFVLVDRSNSLNGALLAHFLYRPIQGPLVTECKKEVEAKIKTPRGIEPEPARS